jgi:large conductance mechanosensitive channel
MGLWGEFKKFILRGNVLSLAVGIIIGAAFNDVVNSLVEDIIMPPLTPLLGLTNNLTQQYINLSGTEYASLAAAREAGAPIIVYGEFLTTLINFLILAFVIFLVVRWFNSLEKKEPEQSPDIKKCPYCTLSIPVAATRCPECTAELAQGQAVVG